VNTVVPHEKLDEAVDALCQEILEKSPTAIAIAKRSFNADSDNIYGIGNQGLEALALFYRTEESREGVRAFMEKRKPDFRAARKR
jgi:2-ketocyclohexanecarboxyl-CoA hydrolase